MDQKIWTYALKGIRGLAWTITGISILGFLSGIFGKSGAIMVLSTLPVGCIWLIYNTLNWLHNWILSWPLYVVIIVSTMGGMLIATIIYRIIANIIQERKQNKKEQNS